MVIFRNVKDCALAQARAKNLRYTEEDHKRACHHISCEACGEIIGHDFADRMICAGKVIRDPLEQNILTWPKQPFTYNDGDGLRNFLSALDALEAILTKAIKDEKLVLFVGAVQYNMFSLNSYFQPHFHFAMLTHPSANAEIKTLIDDHWVAQGGIILGWKTATLLEFGRYMHKHPLQPPV